MAVCALKRACHLLLRLCFVWDGEQERHQHRLGLCSVPRLAVGRHQRSDEELNGGWKVGLFGEALHESWELFCCGAGGLCVSVCVCVCVCVREREKET